MAIKREQAVRLRVMLAAAVCAALSAQARPAVAGDSLSLLQSEVRGTTPPPEPLPPTTSTAPEPSEAEKRDAERRKQLAAQQCERDRFNRMNQPGATSSGFTLNDLGAILVGGVTVVTAPAWLPNSATGDTYSEWGYFPRYPYQPPNGYMLIGPYHETPFDEKPPQRLFAGRLNTAYGTNFNNLDWLDSQLLVETTSRLGFDADWRWLTEDSAPPGSRELNLGDANLFFRFAQGSTLQARAGLGFNWLADSLGSEYGGNFTYALDWYPIQPLVFSFESDLGWLGDTSLIHLRATSGVTWKGAEAFLGYDFLDIGQFQLHGLLAGVRLWF